MIRDAKKIDLTPLMFVKKDGDPRKVSNLNAILK